MLSTKIRTTIIALVASAGISGGAIVPTVAQARMKKTAAEQRHCESLGREFEFWEQQYNTDALNHEPQKVLEQDIAEANAYFEEARLYGCEWTGLVAAPSTGVLVLGEPKNALEPTSPPPVRVTSTTSLAGTLA
jgi:hypothetical protein